jgi:hypothetical protein
MTFPGSISKNLEFLRVFQQLPKEVADNPWRAIEPTMFASL